MVFTISPHVLRIRLRKLRGALANKNEEHSLLLVQAYIDEFPMVDQTFLSMYDMTEIYEGLQKIELLIMVGDYDVALLQLVRADNIVKNTIKNTLLLIGRQKNQRDIGILGGLPMDVQNRIMDFVGDAI